MTEIPMILKMLFIFTQFLFYVLQRPGYAQYGIKKRKLSIWHKR